MMFWIKSSKVIIDCFTPFRSVYDFYKLDRASKFFPDDIAILPKHVQIKDPQTNIDYNISTVKSCVGLRNLYANGFILPMWTDFICQPKSASRGESFLGMVASPFHFVQHSKLQYTGLFSDFIHCKLDSPWKLKEKEGIKFNYNGASWNLHKHLSNYHVLPGVLTFEYQPDTNVNIMVRKDSENFTIHAGQPLVHLMPITDKKVELRHHLVSVEEYNSIGIPEEFGKFTINKYDTYVKEMKKNKCPFGFGK